MELSFSKTSHFQGKQLFTRWTCWTQVQRKIKLFKVQEQCLLVVLLSYIWYSHKGELLRTAIIELLIIPSISRTF